MSDIDAMRAKLTTDWDVDFDDPARVVWTNVQTFDDGYEQLHAAVVSPDEFDDRGVNIRVYRVFTVNGEPMVSCDLDMGGDAFAARTPDFERDMDDLDGWREAIRAEIGGDLVFAWVDENEPLFSFVARTVRVGGDERVVMGMCTRSSDGTVSTTIDVDRPLSDFSAPMPESRRRFG
jgi:hypothetical protein